MSSRRPFRRPSTPSDDDRDPSLELDETEQEALITSLRDRDEQSATVYRLAFTALPALVSLYFLVPLITGPARLAALLGISSLAASGFSVFALPYGAATDGPIEAYLPLLNGVLAAVLGLFGALEWRRGDALAAFTRVVPGLVYVVTLAARREMRPADIAGLERLRYGYKGA